MAYPLRLVFLAILSVSYLYILVSSDSMEMAPALFDCPHITNASKSYRNNINLLLSDFVYQSPQKDYYITSIGDSSDMVIGYYMCRRDLKPQACQNCISNATQFAQDLGCEYQDGIFLSPSCVFRYANYSMYGVYESHYFQVSNLGVNVSDYQQYNQTLSSTIEGLINEAAFVSNTNGSILGFATKEANVTGGKKIYSLAQCTPDIFGVNCSRCLRDALSVLWSDDTEYQGGRVTTSNCLLRYDNQSFYDLGELKLKPNHDSDIRQPNLGIVKASNTDRLRPPNLAVGWSALILFMYYTYLVSY